jgi:hypothetical protein
MPTEWRSAYEAALREQDAAKIAEACEAAIRAINARLLETPNVRDQETEDLEEALRRLTIHRHRHGPPFLNSSRNSPEE